MLNLTRRRPRIILAACGSVDAIKFGYCSTLSKHTWKVRAWDYKKPFYIAPSMSALMWNNSFTETHLMSADEIGITLIRPQSTSGEQCNGAMAEPSLITLTVRVFVESQQRKNKTRLLD